MKLVVYYPDESFLKPAEEAWQRFVEQVQPPPVEVTDIYWGRLLNRWPTLSLRLRRSKTYQVTHT